MYPDTKRYIIESDKWLYPLHIATLVQVGMAKGIRSSFLTGFPYVKGEGGKAVKPTFDSYLITAKVKGDLIPLTKIPINIQRYLPQTVRE
jgi:hypothetical protein